MTDTIADLARQYRFSAGTLQMTTEGFGPEEWSAAPSERGGNTGHWLLGHVASARRSMLRELGEEIPKADWEPLFGMSVAPTGEGYPPVEELFADIAHSGERIDARFAHMDAAQLGAAASGKYPDGGTTREHAARFFFFHEAYHVGQLGLLRRIHGKAGFV
jgi:hypothetical protein